MCLVSIKVFEKKPIVSIREMLAKSDLTLKLAMTSF